MKFTIYRTQCTDEGIESAEELHQQLRENQAKLIGFCKNNIDLVLNRNLTQTIVNLFGKIKKINAADAPASKPLSVFLTIKTYS